MSEPSLRELESEVTAARARLAHDLAVLRSPSTVATFRDAITHEALSMKDALVDKARTEATSRVSEFVDDLKARAAANPAAVLAIGAGIAWRLLRHPPIATALIGAGLISLVRTPAGPDVHQSDAVYLEQAKRRLKEQAAFAADEIGAQASTLASGTAEKVKQWNAEVSEQAANLAALASDKVGQWNAETAARLEAMSARIQATASELMDAARAKAAEVSQHASGQIQAGTDQAADRLNASWRSAREGVARSATEVGRTSSDLRASLAQDGVADKLLLGAAGVAVAAALGIAYQRRAGKLESVE